MNVTEENPFRVLGLSVDATDRQIAKRVNELSTLYEFGKVKSYDTDFPFISKLQRSPDAIERAASQIELPEQKLFHANFWFWSGNSIDDLVYDVLKEGSVEKATALWQRQTQSNSLSTKNYSNYKNLALLNLILSLRGDAPEHPRLTLAIRQFSAVFSHNNYAIFCTNVAGQTHASGALDSEKAFVDELAEHLNLFDSSADAQKAKKFISSFNSSSEQIQSHVKNRFLEAPIHRIETELESMIDVRQRTPEKTYERAKYSFYSSVKEDLKFLKTVLTDQDLHYQSIADRVASELLMCSTAYFNACQKDDTTNETIGRAEELTSLAQKVAVGQATKNKVRDDLAHIKTLGMMHELRR